MTYDLEIDWILLDTCNYRCAYCFSPPEVLARKLRPVATVDEWRDAFNALGRACMVHMTGGEPTIYPEFPKLCAAVTERHFISLNSNLTHRSLLEFARLVDPSRVSFINAALHLEERDRHSGRELFLERVIMLRAQKFPVIVSLVATPAALARFDEAIDLFKASGVGVVPKLFRGVYEGRNYPENYTESEKHRFRQFSAQAREIYQPLFDRNGEWPTIDMLHDDDHVDGVPSFGGTSCDAGHLFVKMMPNGDVMRCGKDKLGNLLERSFKPRRRPAACDTEYCYYFCKKYSRPDRPWLARRLDQWHAIAARS